MYTNELLLTEMDWIISEHARIRSQQRGIPVCVIELILREHDATMPRGRGCRAIYVTRRTLNQLCREGLSPQLVDKTDGVMLVIYEREKVVVTVFHERGYAGRNYRRECRRRRGGRRSEVHNRRRGLARRG